MRTANYRNFNRPWPTGQTHLIRHYRVLVNVAFILWFMRREWPTPPHPHLMTRPAMARFQTKDLLVGITLIAASAWVRSPMFWTRPPNIVQLVLLAWPGSEALIGAGLFKPFGRAWLGAALGVIAQGFFTYLILPVVH